ncbi:MAG: ferredoxin-thioredoxin reductase catalytic chain [Limnospira sp.]
MYPDRDRSSDLSPETSEFSHNHPVDAVGTSELPPALKATSIVALIVVLFGTLIGSLAVSPRPTAMEAEEEIEDTVATEEPATEEIGEMAATPATSVTEDETEIDTATENGTATLESPSPVADGTAPGATPPPTEPAETAGTSPSTLTPSEPMATPETNLTESPTAGTTETPETPETEMAETPEMGADGTATTDPAAGEEMAAAPGAVDVDQLNQIVYDKVDRAWTVKGTPVTANVRYLVTVTPSGAIAGFEPNSPDAEKNVDNTPLPGLAESDGTAGETSGQTVTFEVVFSDTGALEVKPSQ